MAKIPPSIDDKAILLAILRHGTNIVFAVDSELLIWFINRVPSGLAVSDVLGQSCLDYVAPEYHQTVKESVIHTITTGEPTDYLIKATGDGGVLEWYAQTCCPFNLMRTVTP